MSKFTVQQLMEATRAAALERPDHIANPGGQNVCVYFNPSDGTPDCVVGHGLARLGVTLEDVANVNSYKVNSYKVIEVLERLGVGGATGWLQEVQTQQDAGRSWGEAVRIADGEVSE